MKTIWRNLARRLNALSLRERVIMAVSLAVALAAVVDMAVLSPQLAAQNEALARMRSQQATLTTLRAQLAAPAASSPAGALRQRLVAEQARLQAVETALAQRLGSGHAASLPALLQQVLRRHDKLTLLKLDTVPPAAQDAAAPAARRSVELQLAGRYADLLAYAQAIEQQLPGLRWAALQIDAGPQPPVLSARVWLPGDTP